MSDIPIPATSKRQPLQPTNQQLNQHVPPPLLRGEVTHSPQNENDPPAPIPKLLRSPSPSTGTAKPCGQGSLPSPATLNNSHTPYGRFVAPSPPAQATRQQDEEPHENTTEHVMKTEDPPPEVTSPTRRRSTSQTSTSRADQPSFQLQKLLQGSDTETLETSVAQGLKLLERLVNFLQCKGQDSPEAVQWIQQIGMVDFFLGAVLGIDS